MDLARATAQATHVVLATELLGTGEAARGALTAWLAAVAASADGLTLSFPASETRVALTATGETRALVAAVSDVAADSGVADAHVAELAQAARALEPPRAAAWIEAEGDTVDAGWALLGPLPAADALAMLTESEIARRLAGWLDERGVDRARSAGRSLGAGSRIAELVFDLPGDGIVAQATAGREVARRLGVSLPRPALDGLVSLSDGPAYLSLRLTDDGLARLALGVAEPATELVLQARSVAGAENHEGLAVLDATLGGRGPSALELEQTADGFDVVLTYDVTGDEPPPDGPS